MGLFKSTDRGDTWQALASGLPRINPFNSIVISPAGILAGALNGLFRSTTDGTTWDMIGLNSEVKCMMVDGSKIFAGTYTAGLQVSTNCGASWSRPDDDLFGPGTGIKAVYTGLGAILSSAGSKTFRSTDCGISWTEVSDDLSGRAFVQCFTAHDSLLFAGTAPQGVFLSSDRGVHWQYSGLDGQNINAIISWNSTVFAGTEDGVFRSADDGASWQRSGGELAATTIGSFAVCGSQIFTGTESKNGVFRSNDGGATWKVANNGMAGSIYSLVPQGSNLFAGTGSGVFLSTDLGEHWKTVNEGLTNTQVFCLSILGSDIFAGTWGGGVLRRPLSEMIANFTPATEKGDSQKKENTLRIATENKTVRVTLGKSAVLIIRPYSLRGEILAKPYTRLLPAGTHRIVPAQMVGDIHGKNPFILDISVVGQGQKIKKTVVWRERINQGK
jgi:photosystem II stability/assembly factor-like uncharacterized protein